MNEGPGHVPMHKIPENMRNQLVRLVFVLMAVHACMCARARAYIRMRTCTHAHTHTHSLAPLS